jgi:hypothetical protein
MVRSEGFNIIIYKKVPERTRGLTVEWETAQCVVTG